MTRFDKVTAERGHTAASTSEPTEPAPTAKPPVTASTNGFASKESNGTITPKSAKKRSSPSGEEDEEDESQLSSVADTPPPKKKHKPSRSVEDSDAAFAARLQAEENKRAARSTRGGGTTKRKPIVKKSKKERKKKSSARVGSDEDSDAGSGEKKEVKRSGGFHVRLPLHRPLFSLERTFETNICAMTETHGTFTCTKHATQRRNPAFTPANGQEDLGVH